MEKYELRKGEKAVDEYIDSDGKHVTILEDENGDTFHGWILDLDEETAKIVAEAAAALGIEPEDYVILAIETELKRIFEENEKRKAIEEISD